MTAATAYTLFHKTPAMLAIFGFFFSMPCFYYIVAMPQYATTGRFVLLTYNLTCLFRCVQERECVYRSYIYTDGKETQLQLAADGHIGRRHRVPSLDGRHGRRRVGRLRLALLVAL